MKLKIYVAGRSVTRDGVLGVIKAVKEAGHEITLDWTKFKRFEYHKFPKKSQKFSSLELKAIEDSDVFIPLRRKPRT